MLNGLFITLPLAFFAKRQASVLHFTLRSFGFANPKRGANGIYSILSGFHFAFYPLIRCFGFPNPKRAVKRIYLFIQTSIFHFTLSGVSDCQSETSGKGKLFYSFRLPFCISPSQVFRICQSETSGKWKLFILCQASLPGKG